mgnify:CR=1 FL=1
MREMRESGVEWLGDIPETWNLVQLGSLFSEHKNKNIGMQSTNLLSLSYGNIIRKDINTSDGLLPESFEGYNVIDDGDIVLRLTDLQNDQRSLRVGLSRERGIVTSAYVTLRKRNPAMNSQFFYYLIHSYDVRKGFYGMGAGVRQGLNFASIRKIMLTLPSADEQKAIADFLGKKIAQVDTLIANVQAQIEKLKAYKQSLITEVVTKGLDPAMPMKDSSVEWIGSIPTHWEKLRVKNIGNTQNGISKGGEYFGSGYPFVSYGDVYKNMELPRAVAGLVESTDTERANYSVKKGDIFFTRTSETIEEVGFSAVCVETIDDATFAGFLIRLRPLNDALTTQYAKYYFRGEHIRRYLVKEMNLVTRASLGQGLLKAMTVLIPPHEEQIAIAEYLDDKCSHIDRLIAIKQKKIEKFEQYKRSIIYEYVTGKKEVNA